MEIKVFSQPLKLLGASG